MKSFTPWLLVLAAALAVSPIVRTSSESKPADQDKTVKVEAPNMVPAEPGCKPAKDGAQAPPWCEPVRVIRDFFGLEPIARFSRKAIFTQVARAASTTGYKLRFFVALVPDPIDSYPPLSFDLAVDAIQKGFESAQYSSDRVWLPWTLEAGKPQSTVDSLYRTAPGVLLFRGDGDELAVVFLVGESPKTGIQKRAFNVALQIASGLRSTSRKPEVSILGPTFSGSVKSLSVAFDIWRSQSQEPLDFQMASGSATAKGLEQKLSNFCRTVVPDDELQEKSFKFLKNQMGWDLDRMALLTEADTAYGQSTVRESSSHRGLVLVGFPSRISDIRNAWEQNAKVNPAAESKLKVGSTRIVAGRPALDLGLEDRDRAVDQAPSFSYLTTPAKDLELSNVLQTISREGIRYVGVLATDLKDKLFLIRRIRQYAPDTVVFTFDNSLLLAHPQYGEQMDGVVVISSSPLFTEGTPGLPRSGIADGQRQQFVSENQQGIFAAVRYFLVKDDHKVRPQVWISVVGNGSLWPLAHLPVPEVCFCGFPAQQSVPSGPDPSPGNHWLAGKANLQLLVFAGMLCLFSLGLQKTGFLKERGRDGEPFTFVPVDRPLVILGAVLLMIAAAVLLVVSWLPGWAPLLEGSRMGFRDLTLNRILFLASFPLVYGYLCFQAAKVARNQNRGKGYVLWALVGYCALAPLLLVPILFTLWMPGGEIDFFQLRARAFGSGLSPLVSITLLLGAVFLWTLCELKRRWLVQRQAADCPLEALREPAVGGCKEAVDRLRPWLERVFPPVRWLWMLLAALLIPPLILLWVTVQPVTESTAYGRIFLLILALACFLALLSLLRFVAIWLSLEPILRRLNHVSPELQKAFKNLASEIEWKPMRSFAFQAPPFKMLILSVRRLRSLAAAGRVQAQGAGDLLDKIFRSEAAGLSLDEWRFRRQLEDIFKEACSELGDPARLQTLGTREFLALRVVAYLRYIFGHLRDSLMGAIGTGLLILLGVTAYVFQPKQFVSMAIWMTLAAAVAVTFWIFLQMDRNPALSRIAGTTPGEVTFDKTFWANFALYVVIPVLGMVATQFPEVGRLLGRMTDQLLRVAGGG